MVAFLTIPSPQKEAARPTLREKTLVIRGGHARRALNVAAIDEISESYLTDRSSSYLEPILIIWFHEGGENHHYRIAAGPRVQGNAASYSTRQAAKKARTLTAEKLAEQITALAAGKAQTVEVKCCDDEDPPAPKQLGYAYAPSNKNVLSVSVADIDDYEEIAFTGRAAKTPAAALEVATPFSLRVKRSAIPINTNPVRSPRLVLAVPDVDNINVTRSTDGRTLYCVGQDGAAAFGIAVIGHKAASAGAEE
ncbi:MAG: hypothetical protein F4Y04_00455 [Chloroflexi bacterium]|nr:hypothetical protein [Chloroflexota bacterium]